MIEFVDDDHHHRAVACDKTDLDNFAKLSTLNREIRTLRFKIKQENKSAVTGKDLPPPPPPAPPEPSKPDPFWDADIDGEESPSDDNGIKAGEEQQPDAETTAEEILGAPDEEPEDPKPKKQSGFQYIIPKNAAEPKYEVYGIDPDPKKKKR